MKLAVLLLAVTSAVLGAGYCVLGFAPIYSIAYGVIVLMAVMIAGTFLWLWRQRATPLALGMSFSWLGGGGVLGWWWVWDLLGRPEAMTGHPALFGALALYLTGAFLHFQVMGRSLGLGRGAVLGSISFAIGLVLLIRLTI